MRTHGRPCHGACPAAGPARFGGRRGSVGRPGQRGRGGRQDEAGDRADGAGQRARLHRADRALRRAGRQRAVPAACRRAAQRRRRRRGPGGRAGRGPAGARPPAARSRAGHPRPPATAGSWPASSCSGRCSACSPSWRRRARCCSCSRTCTGPTGPRATWSRSCPGCCTASGWRCSAATGPMTCTAGTRCARWSRSCSGCRTSPRSTSARWTRRRSRRTSPRSPS